MGAQEGLPRPGPQSDIPAASVRSRVNQQGTLPCYAIVRMQQLDRWAFLIVELMPCSLRLQMCQRPVYGKKGTDITKLIPHSSLLYVEGVHERRN